MEFILREDIDKLGNRGEVVKVAAGYARNFLLPKRLAVAATASNKKIVAQERDAHLRREAKLESKPRIWQSSFRRHRHHHPEGRRRGHLFGSVIRRTSPKRSRSRTTPSTAARFSWPTPSNRLANTRFRSSCTKTSRPKSQSL